MKKIFVFTVIMAAFLLLLAGCSVNNGNPGEIETTTQLNDEKIYEIEVPVGDSVSSFTFDENNNLLSHNNPGTNSEAELVNYSYDSRGNCICISWFSGGAVIAEKRFEYDENGLCSREGVYKLENGELVFNSSFDYERDENGRIMKITSDSGITEEYKYNEIGLCVSEKTVHADGSLIADAKFYYDEQGRLSKVDSTKMNRVYEYDSQGRLIKDINDFFTVEYERSDDGTVKIYEIDKGETKTTPSVIREYFADGRVIKETWYNGGEVSEINVFSIEEVLANEPDPTITAYYK